MPSHGGKMVAEYSTVGCNPRRYRRHIIVEPREKHSATQWRVKSSVSGETRLFHSLTKSGLTLLRRRAILAKQPHPVVGFRK
jgi:hypothetical protein